MHSEELLDLVVGQALARIIFTIWRSLYGSYEYLPPTTSLGYSLDACASIALPVVAVPRVNVGFRRFVGSRRLRLAIVLLAVYS